MVFGQTAIFSSPSRFRSDSPPWDVAQRLDKRTSQGVAHHGGGRSGGRQSVHRQNRGFAEIWAYGSRNAEGSPSIHEPAASGHTNTGRAAATNSTSWKRARTTAGPSSCTASTIPVSRSVGPHPKDGMQIRSTTGTR